MAGRSVAGRRLRDDVDAVLGEDRPLLVCGEPGTGKLFVATHLHRRHEPSGARIVATARTRGEHTPAGRVLDHLPLSITVPPLRYRSEDVADLAPLLIGAHSTRRPVPRLLPATLRTLTRPDWPGNVRELGSVLATAVTRSLGSDIAHEHLPPEYRSSASRSGRASLRRAERDTVLEALAETHGTKLAAAERLGIARSTLYREDARARNRRETTCRCSRRGESAVTPGERARREELAPGWPKLDVPETRGLP